MLKLLHQDILSSFQNFKFFPSLVKDGVVIQCKEHKAQTFLRHDRHPKDLFSGAYLSFEYYIFIILMLKENLSNWLVGINWRRTKSSSIFTFRSPSIAKKICPYVANDELEKFRWNFLRCINRAETLSLNSSQGHSDAKIVSAILIFNTEKTLGTNCLC